MPNDRLLRNDARRRICPVPAWYIVRIAATSHQTLLKVLESGRRGRCVLLGGHGFGDEIGAFAIEELGDSNLTMQVSGIF